MKGRRLSAEVAVLGAMWRDPGVWHFGLDLMRATKLRAGRFYPALWRLEERGWVESDWDPPGTDETVLRRRVYRLTTTERA